MKKSNLMFNDKAVYFTQKGIEITRTKEDLKTGDFIEEISEQLKEKKELFLPVIITTLRDIRDGK